MDRKDLFDMLGIKDIIDLPGALMKKLTCGKDERNAFYTYMLERNDYDLSYDWFQEIYESELSERKQKKQDFTPGSISRLCSAITGLKCGSVHEPTAGNGSMLIADWDRKMRRHFVWEFLPSKNMFDCWELSNRSIPILLFNLSIRGMMGTVHHGDVLENREECRYLLLNRHDDPLAFSEIIVDETCKMIITIERNDSK